MSSLPSERVAVGGVIDPDVTVASTVDSDYIDMSKFNTAMAIGFAGTLGSSATVGFSIVQASDSSGTGVKTITGKAATQLTQGGTDSDKQAVINVNANDLDFLNNFTFVALRVVVATATSDAGGVILGLDPVHGSAADNDVASVDEIVA